MLSIDEINNLKEENKELKSKLKRLQRQYKNVLDLAKKNADTNEYCLKNLENNYEALSNLFNIVSEKRNIYKNALIKILEITKNNIKMGCAISGGYIEQLIDEVLKNE